MTDQTTRAEEGAISPPPIPVRKRFYLTECEHCGWVGSSEQCFSDGDDIGCPACHGDMAGQSPKGQGAALHGERVMKRILAAESRAASAEAEVERLTRERDAAIKLCEMNAMSGGFSARWAENATNRAEAAEASASALRDRVAVLESALKPFADYAEDMPEWGEGEIGEYFHDGVRISIRTRELRVARAALKESTHV